MDGRRTGRREAPGNRIRLTDRLVRLLPLGRPSAGLAGRSAGPPSSRRLLPEIPGDFASSQLCRSVEATLHEIPSRQREERDIAARTRRIATGTRCCIVRKRGCAANRPRRRIANSRSGAVQVIPQGSAAWALVADPMTGLSRIARAIRADVRTGTKPDGGSGRPRTRSASRLRPRAGRPRTTACPARRTGRLQRSPPGREGPSSERRKLRWHGAGDGRDPSEHLAHGNQPLFRWCGFLALATGERTVPGRTAEGPITKRKT